MKRFVGILVGVLLILSPVLFCVGAVGRLELKAQRIGKHLSLMSEGQWQQVYRSGEKLLQHLSEKKNRTEGVLEKSELPEDLQVLGFDEASFGPQGISFRFGGGHMINSAAVRIIVSPDKGESQGVWYKGWREGRFVDAAN